MNEKEVAELRRQLASDRLALAALRETDRDRERLESLKRELAARWDALEALSAAQERCRRLREELAAAQRDYAAAARQREVLRTEHAALERAFLDQQAGILASERRGGHRISRYAPMAQRYGSPDGIALSCGYGHGS